MKIGQFIKHNSILCSFIAIGWILVIAGLILFLLNDGICSKYVWIAAIVAPYIGVLLTWVGVLKKEKDLKIRERGVFNLLVFTFAVAVSVYLLVKY